MVKYYLTKAGVKLINEAGKTYWQRRDALRKKTAPAPKAKPKLHITPENMARFFGASVPVQREFKFKRTALGEARGKPKATTNRQVITKASVEALGDKLPTNVGTRSTAKEANILALQAKMDAKAALDKKMGRNVNEGIRDWLRGRKKPSQPIILSKRSSAADRGQGKKTGKGEDSLGDQTKDIDNTRANKKAIEDIGESTFKIISPSPRKTARLLRTSRPVFKKTLANVPIGQSSQGDGGSGLH